MGRIEEKKDLKRAYDYKGHEVLEGAYDRFIKKHTHEYLLLEEYRVQVKDSVSVCDGELTIDNCINYNDTNIFRLGDKTWAISLGTNNFSKRDLLAIELKEDYIQIPEDNWLARSERRKEIWGQYKENKFYRNSLIFNTNSGELAINEESELGKRMFELLQPRISDFVVRKPEPICYRRVISNLTLQYFPTTQIVRYKKEFIDFLAETIETILSKEITR